MMYHMVSRKTKARKAKIIIAMERGAAEIIMKSITPEIDNLPRSTAKIAANREGLVLSVTADDTAALRAALNSYLRWIKVASDVQLVGRRAAQAPENVHQKQ
jgi:KEOPS complex subunit Pcc1